MFARFSFWIWGAIITQILTACFHAISFFVEGEPANDTEKQLDELIKTYHMDMGAEFSRTYNEIFTSLSACFSLLCLFAALVNIYMKRKKINAELWKGLLLIEVIVFGILFAVMLAFTFLPPIICTGLILLFVLGSFISAKTEKVI